MGEKVKGLESTSRVASLLNHGQWALETVERTDDQKLKVDLIRIAIVCGQLCMTAALSDEKEAVIQSITDVLTLENQLDVIVSKSVCSTDTKTIEPTIQSRTPSPSLGESYYKINGEKFATFRSPKFSHDDNSMSKTPTEFSSTSKTKGASNGNMLSAVTREELNLFDRRFREKIALLQHILERLQLAQTVPESDTERCAKDLSSECHASSRIELLELRQRQLEDIIDSLVTRLSKETAEKKRLLSLSKQNNSLKVIE